MLSNLKLFLRSLGRNRVHSVITIVGFAVSMAVVLLLMAFIQSERSYNLHYPNIDRMYQVVREDNSASISEKLFDPLNNDIPEIESVTLWDKSMVRFQIDGIKLEGQMLYTDDHFLEIFSVKTLRGGANIKAKDDILITQDFAQKLFGDKDPVGELVFGWGESYTVVGIIETPSPSSGIQYDVLTNREWYEGGNWLGDERMLRSTLLLKEGANPDILRSKISGLSSTALSSDGKRNFEKRELGIRPFQDTYFDTSVSEDQLLHANVSLINLLFYVTLVIIVLAILNYINLTTARGMQRFKEVGIRKTIGAGKRAIFGQFMAETYLICLLSVVMAYGIAVMGKPLFEAFLGKAIDLWYLFADPLAIVWVIGSFLFIGLLAGVIPALSASGFKPIVLLNNERPSAMGFSLRGIMNVFQFAVAIALTIVLLLIMRQVNFVKTTNHGFDKEQLMKVDVNSIRSGFASDFRNILMENPMIVQSSFTTGGPGQTLGGSSQRYNGKVIEMKTFSVDTCFLSTFGIKLLKGRNITVADNETRGCLINETLYKQFDQMDLDKMEGVFGRKVVGVVQDFHFEDLHKEVLPMYIQAGMPSGGATLNLRIRPENMAETVTFIRETYQSLHPDFAIRYWFYDEIFASMYQQEENQAAAIRIFAVLAILISCMGLFGLAEFQARRKIKEIGIRRVNGGRVSEIMVLLNKAFMWWVLVAFVIACPIAWYAMTKWLERFAYKTPLSWWIFALAGVLALGIAILTVSWQSWKAATRNPVESLRNE